MGEQFVERWAAIWQDQAEFNRLFRPSPSSFEERSELTKEMLLNLHSELTELLNTLKWKSHRNTFVRENRAHTVTEIVDIFKFWLSITQAWDVTEDEFIKAYWEKSAVCRQRHSEEWLRTSTDPTAVVDIDNTICDYITGICDWLDLRYPELRYSVNAARSHQWWINAETLAISEPEWQRIKHEFRISGAKRDLPLMPYAKEFLDGLKKRGYQVVLLTSRPIDQYPNLYNDTLIWLLSNHLPFDAIWWAHDKAERLAQRPDVFQSVRFFVDDEYRYVESVGRRGIPCFWVEHRTDERKLTPKGVTRVDSLSDILTKLGVTDVVL
jgi:hypothetical protein